MNDSAKRDWIRALESLRYDITRRDPLHAHKEYGEQHTVNIDLDDSGQVRMIVTRKIGATKSERCQTRSGRAYQIFREQNAVTIVTCRLRAGEDLGAILTEMEKEIAQV